ncbi:hypothetical protein SPRG_19657 [Saprolegnia parasitica CBS 223.65]|uniref:S-formylglutathione hydrolase n=1 Tax=Saprolegnia parasitica (strain CBS 223.65) TaxID=695850 RepID=A0A067CIE9_SAPPC|nr:hypothetical protein SPRG_19657 [Saprolegnia parasitica CBS 223.65]KDO30514.1 hypothetical protein SPRG_19657 [Saprolegnia parasitica CBS 223.65]|eukprot:XP_012198880.1 hypothetical protein SPRG_19657 [Saprolegnia parasitica CBS 223.65]
MTRTTMQFCVFLPKEATDAAKVPAIYYLAGLTCNEELMQIKGGAQRMAAKRGVALITPDTSPRGISIEGDSDNWDFGTGAGFYVDAKEPKWAENYNMYSYVTKELPGSHKQLLPEAFEAACQKVGQPLTLRMQDGYDHGYYFVSSFMEDHINHHADVLLTTV